MLPLAVSLGDPSGIGPEIVARTWERRDAERLPLLFAGGDPRSIGGVWPGPVARMS